VGQSVGVATKGSDRVQRYSFEVISVNKVLGRRAARLDLIPGAPEECRPRPIVAMPPRPHFSFEVYPHRPHPTEVVKHGRTRSYHAVNDARDGSRYAVSFYGVIVAQTSTRPSTYTFGLCLEDALVDEQHRVLWSPCSEGG
jgi:hypothetical protein